MNSGLLSFLFKKQASDKKSGDMKFGLARVIKYQELKKATNSFATELGHGGYGRVYLGKLRDGQMVAVKVLFDRNPKRLEQFFNETEINFLRRLSHPNIVKLLGYCREDKELVLAYEFMAKGSLEYNLFRRSTAFDPLSWDRRLKIVIGAAQALTFLHSSEYPVIYRDFKTSNILLDSNYNAKLSDFGLAKLGPGGESHIITRDFGLEENGPTDGMSHVTTRVIGTYGYAAPEYIATGHLYVKSDVYGFGVVLLEMLSGRRALDRRRPRNEQNLVDWAKSYLAVRRKFTRVMDPRLKGQYPSKAAFQAAQLSLKCLAGEPQNRPSMKEVVETLEHIEARKGR